MNKYEKSLAQYFFLHTRDSQRGGMKEKKVTGIVIYDVPRQDIILTR